MKVSVKWGELHRHCVLADAGYVVDTAFRQNLSNMGLLYAVGITLYLSVSDRCMQFATPLG